MSGDNKTAYEKAKASNKMSASKGALHLTVISACKMGDAGKAKRAFKKVKGGDRDSLAALCSSKGVELQ